MSGSFQEKRLHERKACRTRVVFDDEFGEGLFYVYSRDISLGGIFLESDIPVRMGTMLFLSFALPKKKRPVRATGEVMRVIGPGGTFAGMGIRFVGLSNKTREAIERYLS